MWSNSKRKKLRKIVILWSLLRQVMNVLDSKLKGSGIFPAWVPWQDKFISLHSSGCWCHPPDKRLHKFYRFLSNSGTEGCGWWRVKLQCRTHGFHAMWTGTKLRSMKTNPIWRKKIKGDLPKETWKISLFQSSLGAVWYWATSYREWKPSEIT